MELVELIPTLIGDTSKLVQVNERDRQTELTAALQVTMWHLRITSENQ
ncbi:hypothetical protein ACLBKU_07185 [Erythrobacter sp. NE805]